ncbi:hypothetical protein, partial [Micromonospora sp. KC606]|uniref:hypothetical protein n=1 Tax=Micromonospora sp. KC606 TaxID=2530379 RepID=UPI001A9EA2BE
MVNNCTPGILLAPAAVTGTPKALGSPKGKGQERRLHAPVLGDRRVRHRHHRPAGGSIMHIMSSRLVEA